METVPVVKMSAKGQLVVPEDVRDKQGFHPGDRFVPVALPDGVLFKRIMMPDMKKEFEKLQKDISARWRKAGVTKKTIDEAVRWARRSS